MPTFQEFQEFDLRVGTIVSAKPHPTARNPSVQLDIDFGDGDLKRSSAQLTTRYAPEDLAGRQVIAEAVLYVSGIAAAMCSLGPIAVGDLLLVSGLSHAPPRLAAESAETTEPRPRPSRCCHRESKKNMGGMVARRTLRTLW